MRNGTCKNKKDIKGEKRKLSYVVTETFWWKGFSGTLDEVEGVPNYWKKCTMIAGIEGYGIVDNWEGIRK